MYVKGALSIISSASNRTVCISSKGLKKAIDCKNSLNPPKSASVAGFFSKKVSEKFHEIPRKTLLEIISAQVLCC